MKRANRTLIIASLFLSIPPAFSQRVCQSVDARPKPANSTPQQTNPNTVSSAPSLIAAPSPAPVGQLKLEGKFSYYIKSEFAPGNFVFPAFGALVRMANPPDAYPREWRDGGGAFGRNYGDILARDFSGKTARFATGAVLHEDPRYFPSEDRRLTARAFHAIKFTLIDKGDSGNSRLAVANFASAAAGGFIGNAYLPPGFRDATHAGQRSLNVLAGTAAENELNEFRPEIRAFLIRMHVPFVK
jgi:hypothetical protein